MGGSKPPLSYSLSPETQNPSIEISDIAQFDGGDTLNTDSDASDEESDESIDKTHDEAFSEAIPANLFPIPGQNIEPNQPLKFDVNQKVDISSPLPLCLLLNSRSLYNKPDNMAEILSNISPDICMVSETFERENNRLENILHNRNYKSISYYRRNRSPGGGCAILYNEQRFSVLDLEISALEEVENIWAMISPRQAGLSPVKRVAIGSYYVSPRSRYKNETIEHIIHTIHTLRAKYDNEVNFIIGGDFNRLDTTDILDSYGALHQVISVPTRKSATLEVIITDLHTQYHAPTTLPPLQVDTGKAGQDSDHNIVVFAPRSDIKYENKIKKEVIKTRPLPDSNIRRYENELAIYPWEEIFDGQSVDEKVKIFHDFLRSNLDKYFPEKSTKISNFDKKWMSPELKQLHRSMQREFFKHRKSMKYKQIKSKYKKLKKKSIRNFYRNFVAELKLTDPRRWYSMAQKIGAVKESRSGNIRVESLSSLTNKESADMIAEHF